MRRRSFLAQTSVGVAAAGVAGSGLLAATTTAASAAPASTATATTGAAAAAAHAAAGPMLVRIKNAATGEVGVFIGTKEIVLHDPVLVSKVLAAAS